MTSTVGIKVIGTTLAILNKQTNTIIKTPDKYNRILGQSKNFLVCPVSLEQLFAMVQVGAKGETAQEIAVGLKLPIQTERLLSSFAQVHLVNSGNINYHIRSHRKLFLKSGFKMNDEFKKNLTDVFNANVVYVDLYPSKKSTNAINTWINKHTDSDVEHDMLLPETISDETRAILANVLILQGVWVMGFQQNPTIARQFFIDSTHYILVETLEIVSHFNYYENTQLKAKFLQITYENSKSSLTLALPFDVDGLSNLEPHLQYIIDEPQYQHMMVKVRLPKIDFGSFIPFNNILNKLGIVTAFQNDADFSLVSSNKDDKLKVNKVIQNTWFKIEEKIKSDKNSSMTLPRPTIDPELTTFYANHPFILFLKDAEKGIYFMGRFLQPEGIIVPGNFEKYEQESKNAIA
ncbi:hypothetical protein FQA39_LY00437 [Lamprigera yunnana]|nr:hypothetical protein FQA39_LY00437 [Lamprigera yunnana]